MSHVTNIPRFRNGWLTRQGHLLWFNPELSHSLALNTVYWKLEVGPMGGRWVCP